MNTIIEIIQTIAAMTHGGALVAFALLLNLRHRMAGVRNEDVVRVFRGFGAGIGVSLGLTIYTSIYRFPEQFNPGKSFPHSYALHWETMADKLTTLQVLLFGVLWVSYGALEIWVLEPCRKLDQKGQITDPVAYAATTDRVSRHLAFNALLFCVVVALGVAR